MAAEYSIANTLFSIHTRCSHCTKSITSSSLFDVALALPFGGVGGIALPQFIECLQGASACIVMYSVQSGIFACLLRIPAVSFRIWMIRLQPDMEAMIISSVL